MVIAGVLFVLVWAGMILWCIAAGLWRLAIWSICRWGIPHWTRRPPDLVIGNPAPYLVRWELARPFGCQLALHRILRSDDDRARHDHVSWHGSLILVAGYIEHIGHKIQWRRPGQIIFRKAETPHRLELPVVNGGMQYAWTLWLRGPKWRDWGFHTQEGWLQWEEYGRRYGKHP